jgi:WD40 repeat protein
MSVTGSQLSRSIPFACGATLIGAVRGGLLIDAADGSIEVWDPSSGATRTLSGFAAPQPLNYLWEENSILVTPNWANFCSSDCELVVASSTTGVVKPEVIQPPPGTSLTTTAALSPDGRFVGLVAIPDSTVQAIENQAPSSPPCCYVGSAPVAGEVVIVRSASGQVAMSRPTTLLWPARVQWSADGSYVLVTRSLYHDIEAVPAWSSSAPDSDIHLPSQPTTRYPGEGFVVVAAP